MVETSPEAARVPPFRSVPTAVAGSEGGGVVVVDLGRAHEAETIATWLQIKGHSPLVAPWDEALVRELDVPVVGIVTDRAHDLGRIAASYPQALRIALVDPADEAPGADFVLPRPFRLDLVLRQARHGASPRRPT